MNFTYKQVSTYTLPKKKDINVTLQQIAEKQYELRSIGIENIHFYIVS